MKLSVDRKEKKRLFGLGGIHYESKIKLTLTKEEEKIARKLELRDKDLFYFPKDRPRNDLEHQVGVMLNHPGELKVRDLIVGVTAKCDKEDELFLLSLVENTIREQCNYIQSEIANYMTAKNLIKERRIEEKI